jgi:hypothetical protein
MRTFITVLTTDRHGPEPDQSSPYHPSYFPKVHSKRVPCHHGMVRPQIAEGRDDLQIRWVTANILNKQARIADSGSPPTWGLDMWLTIPHLKGTKQFITKCYVGSRT